MTLTSLDLSLTITKAKLSKASCICYANIIVSGNAREQKTIISVLYIGTLMLL